MANDNDKVVELYDEANRVVRLCEALDFTGIVQHRPQAISALQNVVRVLKVELPRLRGNDDLDSYASAPDSRPRPLSAANEKAEIQERRRQMVEALTHSGLGDRLGKVYSTRVDGRRQPFREAPHKLGLPGFDMVLAPDFSPEDGLHGIFIGAQEAVSCVLPGVDSGRPWQVRERVRYGNSEELVDIVSLMSAGFPVG